MADPFSMLMCKTSRYVSHIYSVFGSSLTTFCFCDALTVYPLLSHALTFEFFLNLHVFIASVQVGTFYLTSRFTRAKPRLTVSVQNKIVVMDYLSQNRLNKSVRKILFGPHYPITRHIIIF